MEIYEVSEDDLFTIKRIDPDGKVWWFPVDERNSDYQRYLRYLSGEQLEESVSATTEPQPQ
jgi:hypothetical protein